MKHYLVRGKKTGIRKSDSIPEKLRIMVAGPVYGGSLPAASYTASAFERLGHTVKFLDYSGHQTTLERINNLGDNDEKLKLKNDFINALSISAFKAANEFRPHLLLAIAQTPLNRDVITGFRSAGIITAYWFIENYRMLNYWKGISKTYDFFFTIQRDRFFEELDAAGTRNFACLPVGCDPQSHKPMKLDRKDTEKYSCDISFAGAAYFNRLATFSLLTGMDFKLWGVNWDILPALKPFIQNNGKRFTVQEMVKIFSGSKISLNLHSSHESECIDNSRDFLNPRLFEISACGGFQIVDIRNNIENYFIPGKEAVIFRNQHELIENISYYLKNEKERARISQNARKRALEDHSYDNRLTEMLDFIFC